MEQTNEKDEIECTNCNWSGDASELESKAGTLSDHDYLLCPRCKKSEYIEDIDI